MEPPATRPDSRAAVTPRAKIRDQKPARQPPATAIRPREKSGLDGGEAAGTVRFGLDGTEYEIDLSTAHSDELRKALEQYIRHGRRTGGTARRAPRSRRGSDTVDTAKVREWAKDQGIEIKDRGRVPASVVEQYKTAAGV